MAFESGHKKLGGRKAGTPNKASAMVRELASEHVEKMIKVLIDIASDTGSPANTRFSCAKEIIYLASGRPQPMPENQPAEADDPLDGLSNAELEQKAQEEIERYQDLKLHK